MAPLGARALNRYLVTTTLPWKKCTISNRIVFLYFLVLVHPATGNQSPSVIWLFFRYYHCYYWSDEGHIHFHPTILERKARESRERRKINLTNNTGLLSLTGSPYIFKSVFFGIFFFTFPISFKTSVWFYDSKMIQTWEGNSLNQNGIAMPPN